MQKGNTHGVDDASTRFGELSDKVASMSEDLTAMHSLRDDLASLGREFSTLRSSAISIAQVDDLRGEISGIREDFQHLVHESKAAVDNAGSISANANQLLAGNVESLRQAVDGVKTDCELRLTAIGRDLADSKANICSLTEELAGVKGEVERIVKGMRKPPADVAAPNWQSIFSKSAVSEFGPTLISWFGAPTDMHLLYSATRDAYQPSAWHAACDGVGPTLTIAVLNWKGVQCAIGGYTPIAWASAGNWRSDPSGKTAIFALRNTRGDSPYLLRAKASEYAVWHGSDLAPRFGRDGSFAAHESPGVCYANVPHGSNWHFRGGRTAEPGLVEDGRVSWAPFVGIETWKW
jgi:hypothetical protein